MCKAALGVHMGSAEKENNTPTAHQPHQINHGINYIHVLITSAAAFTQYYNQTLFLYAQLVFSEIGHFFFFEL